MSWKRDSVEVEEEGASVMTVSGSGFMVSVEDWRRGVGVETAFGSFFLCDRLPVLALLGVDVLVLGPARETGVGGGPRGTC